MASQYVVAKGGCLLLTSSKGKAGKLLQAGAIITDGEEIVIEGMIHPPMTRKKIEAHLRSGYLRPINVLKEEGPISAEDFTDEAPGRVEHPPLPGPGKGEGQTEDKAVVTESSKGIRTSASPKTPSPNKVDQVTSQWTLDPDNLTGKGLDELNVMVSERDASIAAFSTVEEAVAWLSQDFKQVQAVKTSGGKKDGKDSQVATG